MNPELQDVWNKLTKQLTAAQEKRDSAEIQMREAEVEIIRLKKALANVSALMGFHSDEDISALGITEAIRRVTTSRMTAAQVREALTKQGFDLSVYQNPMASIYKILTRLSENELDIEREGWNTFYRPKPRMHRGYHRRKGNWIQAATSSPKPSDSK